MTGLRTVSHTMLRIFVLLLSIHSFSLAQLLTTVSEIEEAIDQSRNLIAQKKYTEAESLLTKTINKKPDNYIAYRLRSKAKYELKDYKGAIEDSKILLSSKLNVDILSLLLANLYVGTCYNSLGEFQKGIYFLKAARNIDSTVASIPYSLAYSYLELGQLDSAYYELDNLLKINPQDERGHYGKGKVFLIKEKYQQAITEFNKAIALNSKYIVAYQNRGEAKRLIGDNEGCCQDWKKCFELGYAPIEPFLKSVCR